MIVRVVAFFRAGSASIPGQNICKCNKVALRQLPKVQQ